MKTALIVPAYKPTEDMIPMLQRFAADENYVAVVVDDGSGPEFQKLFEQVPEGCVLLRHEVNRGKGAALKTAIQHVLAHLPECDFAVTADADGQHCDEDIRRVADSARRHPGALVIGSRAFDGDVPFKSRAGNAITRQVFAIASGVRLQDTQTGLRAFGRAQMPNLLTIPGDRYEYEINMLLYAAQEGIPIREEIIRTIYINDNAASHFNPFRDSLKIYLCIFKFIGSSLVGFGVDFVLLMFLRVITRGMGAERSLLFSVVVARLISATVNFIVNKKIVFRSRESWRTELGKYAALAACILVANYLLMRFMTITLNAPLVLSKLLVEALLFVLSFVVQGRFVYRRKNGREE